MSKNLAGKYRLIAQLGQGGMATVYLAVAVGTSGFRRLAVVKQLRHDLAIDPNLVQMFLDEALLCARLNHRNIVHIYDVGLDECGHLIAMEYLDGVSLHAANLRLRNSGHPLTFPERARILVDVLEGLRYAHELKDFDGSLLNIVHRDVSPPNIILTYDGTVKLLDFGIAKAAISSTQTEAGVIKGKLGYMAPEQARGERVDARADLYAVGVMLWEAVTGRRRWPIDLAQAALLYQLARDAPPESPDSASFGYPAEVDSIVLKALAPRPDDRFQTAAEFLDALEPVLRKLEPVSQRNIGARLSEAFRDERAWMQRLIEQQFRILDVDEPVASGPRSVPHFLGPGLHSDSEPMSRDTLRDRSVTRTTVAAPLPGYEEPPPHFRRTKRFLMAGGLLVAAAAAVAGVLSMRSRGPHSTAGAITMPSTEHARSSVAAPRASELRVAATPRPSEAPVFGGSPKPLTLGGAASAAALDDGAGHGAASDASSGPSSTEPSVKPSHERAQVAASRSRTSLAVERSPAQHNGLAARSTSSSAGAVESGSSVRSSESTMDGELLNPGLPRVRSKPKVELERENPWD